ncbi:MAG: glycerophosphodiester phosphodiesterase family protein [Anaerolineales bacterium]|jgi:glycerophosphoryl diester phosphodiesterase
MSGIAAGLQIPGRARPYLMAHRGNRALFPENTFSAFKRAVTDGADILETDLHLTHDQEIACIHDGTVDRTTDGTGAVSSFSLQELRSLNAAASHPDLPAEPIPTLEELAAWLPADTGLALELKTDRFLEPQVVEHLVALLHRTGIYDRTILLSFSLARLKAAATLDSNLPIGWITLSRIWPLSGVAMLGPFWPLLMLNPFFVFTAHRRGQFVAPLDPAPEPRLKYYQRLGCDAILSDHPHLTAPALAALRAKWR